MRAPLHNLASVQHDDLVSARHSGQTVRHHQRRPPLGGLIQRALNLLLGR